MSYEQEQQRVAVGPGNVHFIFIGQVSSDAATLKRGRCGHCSTAWLAVAAGGAAVYKQFDDEKLIIVN